MKSQNEKVYAIIAFIKPNNKPRNDSAGEIVFKGKSYKGVVFAKTPNEAQVKAIGMLVKAFKGSEAIVTPNVITIKECKLYNDFLIPPK